MSDANRVLFVLGRAPTARDGRHVGKRDFGAPPVQDLENVGAMPEMAGTGSDAIVETAGHSTDMSGLGDRDRITAQFVPGAQLASTTVGVGDLARPQTALGVEATAVL